MDQFAKNIAGGLRRFAMAGVGAITLTVDKSKEIIDQLAERGEVSAAEGQAVCDDLQKKLTEQVSSFTQKLRTDYENLSFDQMLARIEKLTPEQKQRLIDALTKKDEPKPETPSGTNDCEASETAPSEEGESRQDIPSEESECEVNEAAVPEENAAMQDVPPGEDECEGNEAADAE